MFDEASAIDLIAEVLVEGVSVRAMIAAGDFKAEAAVRPTEFIGSGDSQTLRHEEQGIYLATWVCYTSAVMKNTLPATLHSMSTLLVVSDLNRSVQFYTGQLGFELNFEHGGFYAGLVIGHHSIHLKAGSPSSNERQRRRENEDVDLIFGVKDLDGLYEQVCSPAIEIVQPLRAMPYGREFYISDPDGYVLAFIEVTS